MMVLSFVKQRTLIIVRKKEASIMEQFTRISHNINIMGGKACIKGAINLNNMIPNHRNCLTLIGFTSNLEYFKNGRQKHLNCA